MIKQQKQRIFSRYNMDGMVSCSEKKQHFGRQPLLSLQNYQFSRATAKLFSVVDVVFRLTEQNCSSNSSSSANSENGPKLQEGHKSQVVAFINY